jgi:hypothetical protein
MKKLVSLLTVSDEERKLHDIDTRVSGANVGLHGGEWKCEVINLRRFIDRITVTVNTGVAGNS